MEQCPMCVHSCEITIIDFFRTFSSVAPIRQLFSCDFTPALFIVAMMAMYQPACSQVLWLRGTKYCTFSGEQYFCFQ